MTKNDKIGIENYGKAIIHLPYWITEILKDALIDYAAKHTDESEQVLAMNESHHLEVIDRRGW